MKLNDHNEQVAVLVRIGGENGEDVTQYHLPRAEVVATTQSDWDGRKTKFEVQPLGQYTVKVIPGPITLAAKALHEENVSLFPWEDLTQEARDELRRRAKLALEASGLL